MQADQSPGFFNPGQHVALLYADRMRTEADKAKVCCSTNFTYTRGSTRNLKGVPVALTYSICMYVGEMVPKNYCRGIITGAFNSVLTFTEIMCLIFNLQISKS